MKPLLAQLLHCVRRPRWFGWHLPVAIALHAALGLACAGKPARFDPVRKPLPFTFNPMPQVCGRGPSWIEQ